MVDAVIIQTSTPTTRFARWAFDGFVTPALNEALDETPPTHRGSLAVPSSVVTSLFGTVVRSDVAEVESFYRRQGLTATDLLKMNARDALARTPIETIRARTTAPEVVTDDTATAQRGLVVPVTQKRTVDDSVIPAEIPP